jgi:NAD(P)-dependent dehydrogenase (short-subunit alcohol dehydrogenase family)
MDLELTGKRAVVTGGSRGIGFAIAERLGDEGAHVAVVARDVDMLNTAVSQLARDGRTVIGDVIDTTDDRSVGAAMTRVADRLGGIDILVNAAARRSRPGPPQTLQVLVDDDLRTELETKVLGYLRCARAVAPGMIDRGWGRIINIGGVAARQTGNVFSSIRNVSVTALTKNLADELGSSGINVTVVHPGPTRTASGDTEDASDPQLLARRNAMVKADVSLGRIVTAEEVADVVTFLASPRSVAINGDAVVVSGGMRRAIYY